MKKIKEMKNTENKQNEGNSAKMEERKFKGCGKESRSIVQWTKKQNCIQFNIKMSEADIDRIISKYDKKHSKYGFDSDNIESSNKSTQRKKEKREHYFTFMDQQITPTKYENQRGTEETNLLKCLDEAEKKFVLSEKNYAEVCLKYERAQDQAQKMGRELEIERKSRLQELIDFENKIHLLEQQNGRTKTVMEAKDHSIAVLREKVKQKEQEAQLFEQELQEISHKLCETMKLKDEESLSIIKKEIKMNEEEAHRSIQILKEKYEEQIATLKVQISNFERLLIEKEKEKRGLMDSIETVMKDHSSELKDLKQAMKKNEDQYQRLLNDEKADKFRIIERYEESIREARRNNFITKIQQSEDASHQIGKGKNLVKDLEEELLKMKDEVKNYKMEAATLARADEQSLNRIKQLEEELKQTKFQLARQVSESSMYLGRYKEEEESVERERGKVLKIETDMEEVKRKCEEVMNENQQLGRQNLRLKDGMSKELRSLIMVKKELNQATDSQLNINSTLTAAILKMEKKIKLLQEELETTTTELYAERLEKAKVQEDLEEAKVEMRKQYELSVENTRRELEDQIKGSLALESNSSELEKQKVYLEMFKLERNYEILKSEVVTVDEMLKMGHRMSKYYGKKKK